MKKIGIMGGTFNPVHHGHLMLAENAYEQIGLDQILFMPSKNPPHKPKNEIVSEEHRINMIKLAIKDNSHFSTSFVELEREGITYTADTLTELTRKYPDTEFYFIVGADSLYMMQDWMEPQIVFDLSTILVAVRDDVKTEGLMKHAEFLKETFGAKIILLEMPTIEISSNNIRNRVAEHKSIRYYVPDEVITYIQANELYGYIPKE
ncbi:MAG: hypothetical protein K0S47_1388 [Herbinix sp.]|jgi:nicotinate-nucleotide adenylyltransferase|nr:hypothetical protein [Herbinix sp.]